MFRIILVKSVIISIKIKIIINSNQLFSRVNASEFLILTGRLTCQDSPQILKIEKVVLHRYFNAYDHDVALIKLATAINLNNTIKTLKLPLLQPRDGSTGTVSSWRNVKVRLLSTNLHKAFASMKYSRQLKIIIHLILPLLAYSPRPPQLLVSMNSKVRQLFSILFPSLIKQAMS